MTRASLGSPPMPATYVGRFAPSPTGPLHFGSLLAALASFLDARANNGTWLLRIEDLDPPREIAGAASAILHTLCCYGLQWDGPVVYQSQRHDEYQTVIQRLLADQQAYRCTCSRQQIAQRAGGAYDGYCRQRQSIIQGAAAIRLNVHDNPISFTDSIQGPIEQDLSTTGGDFVIQRKDGLFAYQLAVVLDDQAQGVSHIVRGSDLLDSTPRQIHLQQRLGYPTPHYSHIPVMVNADGQKLSKQTYATALDDQNPLPALQLALQVLGQGSVPPALRSDRQALLDWAIRHWNPGAIPRALAVPQTSLHN